MSRTDKKSKTESSPEEGEDLLVREEEKKQKKITRVQVNDIILAFEKSLPDEVGEGSYGKVFRVHMPDGHVFALKLLSPHEDEDEDEDDDGEMVEIFDKEVAALKEFQPGCKDNHILCFVDAMKKGKRYYIATEFLEDYISLDDLLLDWKMKTTAKGESFKKQLKKRYLDEGRAKRFIETFVFALKTIRDRKWAHNDVFRRNVMIDDAHDGSAALIDLGLTRRQDEKFYSWPFQVDMNDTSDFENDRKRAINIIQEFTYVLLDDKEARIRLTKSLPAWVKDYLRPVKKK